MKLKEEDVSKRVDAGRVRVAILWTRVCARQLADEIGKRRRAEAVQNPVDKSCDETDPSTEIQQAI